MLSINEKNDYLYGLLYQKYTDLYQFILVEYIIEFIIYIQYLKWKEPSQMKLKYLEKMIEILE